MYKTYSVTKKQIIDAVLTEPLTTNHFVSYWNSEDKNCSVCAVGAVLRHAGLSNGEISDNAAKITQYNFSDSDLYNYDADLNTDNFLSILSMHHEYFGHHKNQNLFENSKAMDLQRFHLLHVIEAFCPEKVTFKVWKE